VAQEIKMTHNLSHFDGSTESNISIRFATQNNNNNNLISCRDIAIHHHQPSTTNMPPAPRKSVSKGRRSIRGVGTDAQPASSSSRHADPAAASRRRSVATSSKITLDMAPVVPESITHDYVQTPQAPQDLSVGDHERMVQEVSNVLLQF
jgi:DNA polymerase/3'-5' exonuclease PolX